MEAKLFKMMDDQAIIRQMKENYDNPIVLHLLEQLLMEIDIEIEEYFDE